MKYVVICEGASSATLYVEEVLNRGFKPIIINPPRPDCGIVDEFSLEFKKSTGDKAIFIDMNDESEYADVIKRLRELEVIAVVAGSEYGVRYADRISKELGLPGNDPETTDLRCTKRGMIESLEKAGIRAIKTAVVHSEEDIEKFWKENDLEVVFMKLSESASSTGAKICRDLDDAKQHFRSISESGNCWGVKSEVLIQEFIDGEEYIVNSVSCEGRHIITDMWRYTKYQTSEGNVIYESSVSVMFAEPGVQDIVRYAYDVLNATQFKYGPCHGEYKVDKKGPVLIETNARPMGANMTSDFLDEAFGHHITDISLDSYIDPARFDMYRRKRYHPNKLANIVMTIVPYDIDADMSPFYEIIKHLKTFRHSNPALPAGVKHYPKTIDLDTSPMMIKLCGDPLDVINDHLLILETELRYFDLVFSFHDVIPGTKMKTDMKAVSERIGRTMRTLVVTDEKKYISYLDKTEDVKDNSWDMYDACIFAKIGDSSLSGKYRDIMESLSQVRSGGYVFIIPEVYENMPHGAVGIELIMSVMKVNMEIPAEESKGIIYGIKS